MSKTLSLALLAALGASLATPALAQPSVRISGFGQIVAGSTGSDADAFPGANYDGGVDFTDESLFGIQFTASLNERMDAVAQIVARGDRDFEPEFAWAYANINLDGGFGLRAGRQRTAFYRYSDFLDVGFAYPWVRPPVSVYNIGFDSIDGLTLSHNTFLGDWFSQLQVQYGQFDGDARNGTSYIRSSLDDYHGIAWDMEYDDWFGFRLAWFRADVSFASDELAGLSAMLGGAGLTTLAESVVYDGDRGTFFNAGLRYDRNNWLLQGEYVRVKVENTVFSDKTDWYVSAAYRFGALTPNLTWGRRDADAKTGLLAGLPEASPVFAPVAGLVLAEAYDDRYLSAGLRWDLMDNMALKFDWTQFRTRTDRALTGRDDADLYSAGLVFTF
ncbi:MAG: porin [Lysobacteraceae bacterium]